MYQISRIVLITLLFYMLMFFRLFHCSAYIYDVWFKNSDEFLIKIVKNHVLWLLYLVVKIYSGNVKGLSEWWFFLYFRMVKSNSLSFEMKIFSYIVIAFVAALIVLNITMLDFNNLFQGDSLIALIGIVALLCAVCILLIYRTSKMINDKTK